MCTSNSQPQSPSLIFSSHASGGDPGLLPTLTIDDIPDEVLLEIFDFYRKYLTDDQSLWNKKYKWFKLIHVCRRWRHIVFASFTRLDLCLFVRNRNPGNIKTIFSPRLPPLPIVIDYNYRFSGASRTGTKELGRMLAALKRCDRVRGITFSALPPDFYKLTKATKCPFPILEDLQLCNMGCGMDLELSVTFLKGSAPNLRRLILDRISLTSISSLLSSATMLTELCLTTYTPFSTESLLAPLQSMHFLRRFELKLQVWKAPNSINGPMPPTNPGDTFLLSKLTYFLYCGPSLFLSALVAGFTAPSLQNIHIILRDYDNDEVPIFHLIRFLDDVEKQYRSVRVIFKNNIPHASFYSEAVDHDTPSFTFFWITDSDTMMRTSAALSPKLSTVEELLMVTIFDLHKYKSLWDDDIPLPNFLQRFRSVKVLRVEHGVVLDIAKTLQPDDEPILDVLPMLEEIEIRTHLSESHLVSELAVAFHPFIAARQEAGRPVKLSVSFSPNPTI